MRRGFCGISRRHDEQRAGLPPRSRCMTLTLPSVPTVNGWVCGWQGSRINGPGDPLRMLATCSASACARRKNLIRVRVRFRARPLFRIGIRAHSERAPDCTEIYGRAPAPRDPPSGCALSVMWRFPTLRAMPTSNTHPRRGNHLAAHGRAHDELRWRREQRRHERGACPPARVRGRSTQPAPLPSAGNERRRGARSKPREPAARRRRGHASRAPAPNAAHARNHTAEAGRQRSLASSTKAFGAPLDHRRGSARSRSVRATPPAVE